MTSSCESTNPATDAATGVYGYGHLTGGYEGGQAEYVRAPFIAVDAEKIPEDMDDLTVLPLTDAISTGYFGAEMCNLKGGETAVVFGAGPVGLFAMRSLWLMGAGRVIARRFVGHAGVARPEGGGPTRGGRTRRQSCLRLSSRR